MNGHPGGEAHTRHMTALAALPEGARILDMGAGAGEAVNLLNELGYRAEGIDLLPRSALVLKGDLLRTPYPDESFDAVLSQCTFFVSGDVPGAMKEAWRLLKHGGRLMLSDVDFGSLRDCAEQVGFRILREEDLTPEWRDYFFEALWQGETFTCHLPKGRCAYRLLIGAKE